MKVPTDRIVILGAGQAGGWAAITLRNEGYEGDIVLVGEEPYLPYERPPLSKSFLAGKVSEHDIQLMAPEAYVEKCVRWVMKRCTKVDASQQEVTLEDGSKFSYDKLIFTTGSRVRKLSVDGSNLEGIHYLRTVSDASFLRRDLMSSKHLLVVGGGWIGLEVAATARLMGVKVTVVEFSSQLCSRSLTSDASRYIESLHRTNGVDIRFNTSVTAFQGQGRLEKVMLSDGTMLSIDCAVIGIGILPNDELAAQAGINVNNGIVVDDFAQTSVEGVYAAGDVTSHPNAFFGERIRLETWENAQNQGVYAAKAALGHVDFSYSEVPWVWSDQYECNIQVMGFTPTSLDRTVLRGDPQTDSFTFAYLRNGELWGAVSFNQGRDNKVFRKLMQSHVPVTPEILQAPIPELLKLTRR